MIILPTFIFGAIIGSFLNVVIHRLPRGERLNGRSHCPHCHRAIAWHDLIPLISFVLLKGKCRSCYTPISWQYPAVELATGGLFALSFSLRLQEGGYTPLLALSLFRDWVIISALVITFVTDLRFQLIFDVVMITAGLITLPLNLILGEPLLPLLLAGIIGVGFFGFQYVISRGRWIGVGDLFVGGFIGVAVSYPLILLALAGAYLSGAAISIPLLFLKSKTWQSRIAFGTFLSLAGIVTLFWGDQILEWYLHTILAG
ncbi:MAG: prepilin peptidase [Patescibacteria group bacterium]